MKQVLKIFLTAIILFWFSNLWIAAENWTNLGYLDSKNFTQTQKLKNLKIKWLFILYFNEIWEWIPDSYKYIDLKFLNVPKDSTIYDALQKWVYLDLIKNLKIDLNLDSTATEWLLYRLVKKNFDAELIYEANKPLKLGYFIQVMNELKNLWKEEMDMSNIDNSWSEQYNWIEIENADNFNILNDVYSKIKNDHYDSDKFKSEDLLRWAMKWIAEATWDKYTTYFPPAEAKSFNDELSWEFEWIGAQVDMDKPWNIIIVAPLSDSPAERAWLKAQDRIIKIDSYEVTEKTTLDDAINRIKWQAWTEVRLTIIRDWQEQDIFIKREKISIKYTQYKMLDNGDNYIKISIFGAWTYSWFKDAVLKVKENPYHKTIIDLRSNPGGSLDEVANILNFFVPEWESSVNIKYKDHDMDINSLWSDIFTFENKKVVILIDKWSASASEIMAGTIKDYFWNNCEIIWENSYWKWSVQNLEQYIDWSSIKYTIAKWFTWKSKNWIDWIWIKPDIEIKLNEDSYRKWTDNQLDYAKSYNF